MQSVVIKLKKKHIAVSPLLVVAIKDSQIDHVVILKHVTASWLLENGGKSNHGSVVNP